MELGSLRVIHQCRKGGGRGTALAAPVTPVTLSHARILAVETCQRSLWITLESEAELASAFGVPEFEGFEIHRGEAAYEFLLRVSTGLESELSGETQIFGQIKESWKKYQGSVPASPLAAVMQKLFEDTKDIRSQCLQGIGGAGYGSLVRKLLKEQMTRLGVSPTGTVLLAGAGDMAHAVAPWLHEFNLVLTNRSPERLRGLYENVVARPGVDRSRIRVVTPDQEPQAYRDAAVWVFCIPFDAGGDSARVSGAPELVVHLGGFRHAAGPWTRHRGFHCLDDLFGLQESRTQSRSAQLARAAKACADRAKLRMLNPSLSIAHGWEDLAAFG